MSVCHDSYTCFTSPSLACHDCAEQIRAELAQREGGDVADDRRTETGAVRAAYKGWKAFHKTPPVERVEIELLPLVNGAMTLVSLSAEDARRLYDDLGRALGLVDGQPAAAGWYKQQ
jgi:hypothetical protein